MFSRESRRCLRVSGSNVTPPDSVFDPVPASSRSSTSSSSTARHPPLHDPGPSSDADERAPSEDVPATVEQASTESALFAPTSALSHRQVSRLDRRFHEEERRAARVAMREVKAGVDIALGVRRLYKAEKDKARAAARRNSLGGDGGTGSESHGTAAFGGIEKIFDNVERRVEETVKKGSVDRLSLSGDRKLSIDALSPRALNAERVVAGAVGVAGVVGLAGLGWEWYLRHEQGRTPPRLDGEVVRPASAPARSPVTPYSQSSMPFAIPHTALPPPTIPPRTMSPASTPIFISHLTPSQHKTLQHASAALLLKHHERHHHGPSNRAPVDGKSYHYDEIGLVVGAVVGGWTELTRLVEAGLHKVGHRTSHRLFGVDLKELTKHEGVASKHGIDPNARGLRIPEFLDHLITALKQSDMSVSGILRKSANVQKVLQIIDALDHSDGSGETVLDLAKLDPVTLADLFQRFLGALPHPVFTHHLFGLFVATSHIHHPGLRRRAMHLVICLMPKPNRDVMECVFLFLTWLSKHAHVSVIDGERLDLTGIATIMAPILLRPKDRDPHPTELNSMIAAVLNLLEDQHILHGKEVHTQPSRIPREKKEEADPNVMYTKEIPFELAHLLHLEPPAATTTTSARHHDRPQSATTSPMSPTDPGEHDVAGFIQHLLAHL
ncbi:hypothetical protein JCM11491_000702 [Sporobolomyces phaffii]